MILLTGATSDLGREVVRLLKQTDSPFKIFTRSETRAKTILGHDIECIQGDFNDRESMFAALEGVEILFLNTPRSENELVINMQFIEAAVKQKVKHIVKLSLPIKALEPEIRAQWGAAHVAFQIEERLRHSGRGAPAATIINPNPTMQDLVNQISLGINLKNSITLPFGEGEIAPVDLRDIAAVVVKILTEDGHKRKAYTLTGSTAHTLHDIAAFAGRAADRTINYRPLPLLAAETSWSLNRLAPFTLANKKGEATYFQADGAEIVTDTVSELLGRPPRTLPEYLAERPDLLALDEFGVQQKQHRQLIGAAGLLLILLWLWRRNRKKKI